MSEGAGGEPPVAGIWKWVAITAVGILLGGAPGYALLVAENHAAMTREDVDKEIDVRNAAIVQQLSDLKASVEDLSGQVRESLRMNRRP